MLSGGGGTSNLIQHWLKKLFEKRKKKPSDTQFIALETETLIFPTHCVEYDFNKARG